MSPKELRGQGDELFGKRSTLMLLEQEIAEHFYPERADFTYQRTLGVDFAGDMMTSYPMMCRRELGDQIGQMLRPTDKEYAHIVPIDKRRQDNESQRWIEWSLGTQRRAMYDRKSQFVDSEKLGDHDFASFGMCVTQVRLSKGLDRLLYLNWHLRDMAWLQNADREIVGYWRKAKCQARDLVNTFGKDKVHRDVAKCLDGTSPQPFKEFECFHMEVMIDLCDVKTNRQDLKWCSIWYDCEHDHILEELPIAENTYCVARWLKPGTSQYAFSPAVTCALPEARMLQAMTFTLMEAGEKVVNPPLIAVDQAIRSDINVFPGGITWSDRDYDERFGDVLRPMNIESKGMGFGMEMTRDSRAMIMQALFLNKLNLPQRAAEMTAYETGQRVQEYIRGALPIFEPMEQERNGQIWEKTFNLMLRHRGFGSPLDMPKSLREISVLGTDGIGLQWQFESPLHDAIDQVKGAKFLEAGQYVAAAVQLDPKAAALIDVVESLRDVLQGVKVPAKWVRNEITVQQINDQAEQAAAAQQQLALMQQGSEVVGNLASAGKDTAMSAMPA
mgnify:CR=1 FL=1